MIRSLPLVCATCQKTYAADAVLYYREDYTGALPLGKRLICPACLAAWEQQWQLASAVFREQDYCLFVDLETQAGERLEELPCSVLDDRVVVSVDLPENEKKKLFQWYLAYRDELDCGKLKSCQFSEVFMRTTFTCETNQGERYEDIAFRVSRKGELETEKPIPAEIGQQVLEAWRLYSANN